MRSDRVEQTVRPLRAAAALAALAALLAGCSSERILSSASTPASSASASAPASTGSTSSGSIMDSILPRRVDAPATDPNARAVEFANENCPQVDVRQGASTFTLPPGATEAFALRYQGTIAELARECSVAGGVMRIKVGVQGRVLVGPAATGGGQIDMPLRYAVVKEGAEPKTVVSKFHRVGVTVPDGQPNVAFTHVDNDVAFPLPPDFDLSAYIVYVGFDPIGDKQQPAKKPATKARAKPAAARR